MYSKWFILHCLYLYINCIPKNPFLAISNGEWSFYSHYDVLQSRQQECQTPLGYVFHFHQFWWIFQIFFWYASCKLVSQLAVVWGSLVLGLQRYWSIIFQVSLSMTIVWNSEATKMTPSYKMIKARHKPRCHLKISRESIVSMNVIKRHCWCVYLYINP